MSCLGSTANSHESPPPCSTGQHAGCLLQNQERSPIAIHHWQQDCYTPLQGSKESATIYFSWRPQEIFCPLPPCLGLCPAWRGGHVPFLHPKMSPVVRRFVQDVSPWHESHPRQAPCCSSIGICQHYGMALIRTPLDVVVCLTATMSNLNILSNVLKDDQMESYIDEMDWQRLGLLVPWWHLFPLQLYYPI